jgi:hypothetical protein
MILVFKTSVKSKKAVKLISPHLNKLNLNKWNFDLNDCDNILRIDTSKNLSVIIISKLKMQGYECMELK